MAATGQILLFLLLAFKLSLGLENIEILEYTKLPPGSWSGLVAISEQNGYLYEVFFPPARNFYSIRKYNLTWDLEAQFSLNITTFSTDPYIFNSSIAVIAQQVGSWVNIVTVSLTDFSLVSDISFESALTFLEILPLNALPANAVGMYFENPSNSSSTEVVMVDIFSGQTTLVANLPNFYSHQPSVTADPSDSSSPGIFTACVQTSSYFTFIAYDLSTGENLASVQIPNGNNYNEFYVIVQAGVVAWTSQDSLIFYDIRANSMANVTIPTPYPNKMLALYSNQNGVVYAVQTIYGSQNIMWMLQYNSTTQEGQLIGQGTLGVAVTWPVFEGENMRTLVEPPGIALIGPSA